MSFESVNPWEHGIPAIKGTAELAYTIAYQCIKERDRQSPGETSRWAEWFNSGAQERRRRFIVRDYGEDDNGKIWVEYGDKLNINPRLKLEGIAALPIQGGDLTFHEPELAGEVLEVSAHNVKYDNGSHNEDEVSFTFEFEEIESIEDSIVHANSYASESTFGGGFPGIIEGELKITLEGSTTVGYKAFSGTRQERSYTTTLTLPGTKSVGIDGTVIPRIVDDPGPPPYRYYHEDGTVEFIDDKERLYRHPLRAGTEYWASNVEYKAIATREIGTFTQRVTGRGSYTVDKIRIWGTYGRRWDWSWQSLEHLKKDMRGLGDGGPWPFSMEPRNWEAINDQHKNIDIDFTHTFKGGGLINVITHQKIT